MPLDAFLRRCDAVGPACAFSDGGSQAKYDELRTHVRNVGPLTLPDGTVVNFEAFVGIVGSGVFAAANLVPLAETLQALFDALHSPAVPHPASASVRTLLAAAPIPARSTPYTGTDANPAVACSDEPYRIRPNQIPRLADRWERQLPTFGRELAWSNPAGCADWPIVHRDVYSGPWHRPTPNPVLLFGNSYDPATPFEFSRQLARDLGSSRLVGVDAFGHTILGQSTCTATIAADYLIDLRLPAPGTICHPDVQPF